MATYQEIKNKLENCIACLEENRFKGGTLSEIQNLICNLAENVKDLNDLTMDLEDRVNDIEERLNEQ